MRRLIANLNFQDFSPLNNASLGRLGEVIPVDPSGQSDVLRQLSSHPFSVLVCGLEISVDGGVYEVMPELRVVATATTGLDHIDLFEAKKRNIHVLSLRDARESMEKVSATAELTWGLVLSITRQIVPASLSTSLGEWDRQRFLGPELQGLTLGVVGYGRIGSMVAGFGHAFGMRVLVHEPFLDNVAKPQGDHEMVPDHVLLRESDVVSIHLRADGDKGAWLNQKRIDFLKRGAFVVNTARGELVDEGALARAVMNGSLSGAAVDVLVNETKSLGTAIDSPLLEAAREGFNVLVTPHIGGRAHLATEISRAALVAVLCEFLAEWTT